MPDQTTQKLLKKHRLLKKLITFLGLAAVCLAAFYLLSQLNKPVTANVDIGQEKAAPNTYHIDLTPTPISGHYASFKDPKGLHLVNDKLISAPSVEDFKFYVKDVYSWTLAIDVSQTPTGSLSESSSFALRRANPKLYGQSFLRINGQRITVMTDRTTTAGFSKVAYLTHGTLVATVSLVGNDSAGTQPLVTTFAMVLNSWRWI